MLLQQFNNQLLQHEAHAQFLNQVRLKHLIHISTKVLKHQAEPPFTLFHRFWPFVEHLSVLLPRQSYRLQTLVVKTHTTWQWWTTGCWLEALTKDREPSLLVHRHSVRPKGESHSVTRLLLLPCLQTDNRLVKNNLNNSQTQKWHQQKPCDEFTTLVQFTVWTNKEWVLQKLLKCTKRQQGSWKTSFASETPWAQMWSVIYIMVQVQPLSPDLELKTWGCEPVLTCGGLETRGEVNLIGYC